MLSPAEHLSQRVPRLPSTERADARTHTEDAFITKHALLWTLTRD
jgi:hypothetical protein